MDKGKARHHQKAHSYLKKADPILAKIIIEFPLEPSKPRKNYFRSLVRAIIGQQLSTKAADSISKKFESLFSNKTFPLPKEVLKMKDAKLRSAGLSFSKITYIKEIAKAFETGQIKPAKLSKMSDEEIVAELTKIKGVGRWTAEMFLMFTLARPNVFSHGDFGLRKGIQKLYGFKKGPTLKEMEKIVAKWSPYKTTASRYIWHSLDNN